MVTNQQLLQLLALLGDPRVSTACVKNVSGKVVRLIILFHR
jgi:hypothetical protein